MTCQPNRVPCIPMTLPGLDRTEERAWRGFRRLFTLLEARLGRELLASTGLSMADYTVLSTLVELEERRSRLVALAERIQWSQSRLSHHVTRMENRGLVSREQVDHDTRGSSVVLTRRGLKAIAEASPVHLTHVRHYVIDLLTRDQLEMLGVIAEVVVARLNEENDES